MSQEVHELNLDNPDEARIAFEEKRERTQEALQAEAVEQYEAQVEGRAPVVAPPPPAEVIAGVEIPQVTPQEPEYVPERVLVQDPSAFKGTLTMQGGQYYQTKRMKNPRFVSPEDRAKKVREAERAQAKQAEVLAKNLEDSFEVPELSTIPPREATSRSLPEIVGDVQTLLGDRYQVVGMSLVNNQIVLTLE
jgi:hypothetical protein